MEGEATVQAAVGTVVEGRVDIGGEIPVGAYKSEAESTGGDEVGGEASDFAPSDRGEAPLVNKPGQDFKGEDDIASYGRDEAGEPDDPAGIVEAVDEDGSKAGVGEEQFQGVVCDRVARGKAGLRGKASRMSLSWSMELGQDRVHLWRPVVRGHLRA